MPESTNGEEFDAFWADDAASEDAPAQTTPSAPEKPSRDLLERASLSYAAKSPENARAFGWVIIALGLLPTLFAGRTPVGDGAPITWALSALLAFLFQIVPSALLTVGVAFVVQAFDMRDASSRSSWSSLRAPIVFMTLTIIALRTCLGEVRAGNWPTATAFLVITLVGAGMTVAVMARMRARKLAVPGIDDDSAGPVSGLAPEAPAASPAPPQRSAMGPGDMPLSDNHRLGIGGGR